MISKYLQTLGFESDVEVQVESTEAKLNEYKVKLISVFKKEEAARAKLSAASYRFKVAKDIVDNITVMQPTFILPINSCGFPTQFSTGTGYYCKSPAGNRYYSEAEISNPSNGLKMASDDLYNKFMSIYKFRVINNDYNPDNSPYFSQDKYLAMLAENGITRNSFSDPAAFDRFVESMFKLYYVETKKYSALLTLLPPDVVPMYIGAQAKFREMLDAASWLSEATAAYNKAKAEREAIESEFNTFIVEARNALNKYADNPIALEALSALNAELPKKSKLPYVLAAGSLLLFNLI